MSRGLEVRPACLGHMTSRPYSRRDSTQETPRGILSSLQRCKLNVCERCRFEVARRHPSVMGRIRQSSDSADVSACASARTGRQTAHHADGPNRLSYGYDELEVKVEPYVRKLSGRQASTTVTAAEAFRVESQYARRGSHQSPRLVPPWWGTNTRMFCRHKV